MTILAFECCFGACSASLRWQDGGRTHAVSRLEVMERGHSERMVPMIAEILAEANLAIGDVDAFAVTIGPGSFTGVRTGIAVARGFALATGKPVHGTSSLHVMAAGLRQTYPEGPIAIAISTRDGLVYFQTFDGANASPQIEPRLATPEAAVAAMAGIAHIIGGTGAGLIVAAAGQIGQTLEQVSGRVDADAAVLARLAPGLPVLSPPHPLYLREPDAKPQPGVLIQRTDQRPETSV